MLEANQHTIVGKTFGNRVSRVLLRMAFGKSKLSLDEEVITRAPWLRKSGLILVVIVMIIGVVFEFFLLDTVLRKGLESAIATATGAEVNVEDAHLSLAQGELSLQGLQVTDPDKPTHNLVQIDQLIADVNISQLLTGNYAMNLLAGSTLKRDVARTAPGAVYKKPEKELPETESPADMEAGLPLDHYFAQAGKWSKYGEQAYDYLRKRKENTELAVQSKVPQADKLEALENARRRGYLSAFADLVADRPAWLIHQVRIERVDLGSDMPEQILEASELSSHPELNRQPSSISLTPADGNDPTVRLVLRFDDPAAMHAFELNLPGIPLSDAIETSESFPLNIEDGRADVSASGRFSAEALDIPFALRLHDMSVDIEQGEQIMGMDSSTAAEVFNALEELAVDGEIRGSLPAPRIWIDYEKLTANLKEALISAGKNALANRANAEIDKAKEELQQQTGEQINKLLEGEEGNSLEDTAKDALRNLF